MTASRTAIAAAVIVLSACALGASAQPLLLTPTGSPTPGQAPPELAFLQSGLFTPVVAAAARAMACGPYCDTFSGGTTATEQGAGSSCAAAQTSLTSQLQDLAGALDRASIVDARGRALPPAFPPTIKLVEPSKDAGSYVPNQIAATGSGARASQSGRVPGSSDRS